MCSWGVISHPSLAGFSSTGVIHIPVSLPLPAAGGQLEAVEWLGIHSGHIAPRPTVGGQQCVSKAIHWVPPLKKQTLKKKNTDLALIINSISIYSVKIYNLVPPGFHRSPPGSGSGSHWASYWGKHGGHSRCPSSAPSLQRHVWALAASHQHVPSAGRL